MSSGGRYWVPFRDSHGRQWHLHARVAPLDETLHLLGFIVVFTSLISALFLLGGLWWQTPPWRGSGWYSLLCALLIVGVFIALATVANPLHLGGLFQRLLVICAFSWYVVGDTDSLLIAETRGVQVVFCHDENRSQSSMFWRGVSHLPTRVRTFKKWLILGPKNV